MRPPLARLIAKAGIAALRPQPITRFGQGGRKPVDEGALVDLLLRVSTLAEAVPEVAELELKPLIATPEGVVLVDARVRVVPPPTGPGPLLRRLR